MRRNRHTEAHQDIEFEGRRHIEEMVYLHNRERRYMNIRCRII
jgi:hypothetical protein